MRPSARIQTVFNGVTITDDLYESVLNFIFLSENLLLRGVHIGVSYNQTTVPCRPFHSGVASFRTVMETFTLLSIYTQSLYPSI